MPLTYTPGASDPTGPYTSGGTFDYQQANNIEAGIGALYDVLTGVKTDSAITLHYAPGAAGSPTLTLLTDGNVGLLKGIEADGTTQAFAFDANGNLTLAGTATLAGIANGASNLALPNSGYIAPNGEIHANSYWGPLYGEWHGGSGQQPLSVYDDGASIHLRVGPSAGSVGRDIILETWNSGGYWAEAAAWTQTQRGIINAYDYPYPRNINVYEGTTDPSTYTTPNEGDLWMDG